MNIAEPKFHRVLAVSPSTRGFGYAVLDGGTLIDWGLKTVKGDKNTKSVPKVERLIVQYEPEVVALEDYRRSRRGLRAKLFIQAIIDLAPKYNIGVTLFSRTQIYTAFFADGKGTKDALAELLAKRFPEELGFRLPPKRKVSMNEDYRMALFDAVALGLILQLK